MAIPKWSALGEQLALVGNEFRKRGCKHEVEGEMTTQVFMVDGVECQMIVTIKVFPVATGSAAASRRGSPLTF